MPVPPPSPSMMKLKLLSSPRVATAAVIVCVAAATTHVATAAFAARVAAAAGTDVAAAAAAVAALNVAVLPSLLQPQLVFPLQPQGLFCGLALKLCLGIRCHRSCPGARGPNHPHGATVLVPVSDAAVWQE